MNIQLGVYSYQVSGKEPKLLTKDLSKLLKGFNQTEAEFYKEIFAYHISHPYAAIQKHLPNFSGFLSLQFEPQILLGENKWIKNEQAWLTHLAARYKMRNESNRFIVLQNLTHGMTLPNIFDIKIGGRNVEGKKHKITKSVSRYFIKLNGCRLNFPLISQKSSLFLSKYYLFGAVESHKILEYLSLFFFNGKQFLMKTLTSIRQELLNLILSMKSLKGYRFVSSSLCLIYDAHSPNRFVVRLLDFGRVQAKTPQFLDDESIFGLQNIYQFLGEIAKSPPSIANLTEIQEYYQKAEVTIVPQKKLVKYGDQNDIQVRSI